MPKLETRAEFEARYPRTTHCCPFEMTAHPIFGSHFLGCPHCGWEVGVVTPQGISTPDGSQLLRGGDWAVLSDGARYRSIYAGCCGDDCVERALDNAQDDGAAEAIEAEHGESADALYLEVSIGDVIAGDWHVRSDWCEIHADGGPTITPAKWVLDRQDAHYRSEHEIAHVHVLGPFWPDTSDAELIELAEQVALYGSDLYAADLAKNRRPAKLAI